MPDFVLPDGRWVEFKLHIGFREHRTVAWRPQTLLASLRKYIDHPANPNRSLIIVYRHIHGAESDLAFPLHRGSKVLLHDVREFRNRIRLVDVMRLRDRLERGGMGWVLDRVAKL